MAFLKIEDFDIKIKRDRLLTLLELNHTALETEALEKLRPFEDRAVEEIKKKLSLRYDLAYELSQVDSERNKQLINFLIDLSAYFIYAKRSSDVIPDTIEADYKNALKSLAAIRDGKEETDLQTIDENGDDFSVFLTDNENYVNRF